MDWRHKAVCRDEDPELFFPVGNSGPAIAQIADAKLVCNRCPVTTECLSWALESGQDSFVAVRLADGSIVRVQAHSEVQLQQLRRRGRAGSLQSVLEMHRGSVFAIVTYVSSR